MRTSSLDIQEDKNKEDQDNRILKIQMEDANKAIKTLTMELAELQKMVKGNPPTPTHSAHNFLLLTFRSLNPVRRNIE